MWCSLVFYCAFLEEQFFSKTKCANFKGPFIFDLLKLYKPPFYTDGWWIVGVRLISTVVGFFNLWTINPVFLFLITKTIVRLFPKWEFVPRPPSKIIKTQKKNTITYSGVPNKKWESPVDPKNIRGFPIVGGSKFSEALNLSS